MAAGPRQVDIEKVQQIQAKHKEIIESEFPTPSIAGAVGVGVIGFVALYAALAQAVPELGLALILVVSANAVGFGGAAILSWFSSRTRESPRYKELERRREREVAEIDSAMVVCPHCEEKCRIPRVGAWSLECQHCANCFDVNETQ